MSENLRILYYAMWIAHPILEVGIGILMLRHGLLKQFKFFFGYILAQLATFVILFSAYAHSYAAAFYLFWVCNAFSVTFGFLVIHEVFVDVFRLFHTLRDLGSVLFKWAGLVMLLVAGVVSVSTNSSEVPPWMQAIITSQRCVRFIQVGMVLFLLFFAHYVGVSRRQLSFGVALGFGSFAVVELILISSFVGNHLGGPWMDMVNMLAYNASLGIVAWLCSPETTGSRRNSISAAAAALGAEPVRHPQPSTSRFIDSDVRRHGRSSALALQSGGRLRSREPPRAGGSSWRGRIQRRWPIYSTGRSQERTLVSLHPHSVWLYTFVANQL